MRRADLGRRARLFESAVSDLLSRDVRQLSDIGRPANIRRLLNAIAAHMASLIVPGTLAGRLQIPTNTLKRYLDLLELLYVVHRVPAWSTNLTTRAIATQKMIVTDSGLAGHLAGLTMKRATRPTAPVGPIVENFVLSELARQLSWTAEPVRLHHYRDRDGYEMVRWTAHALAKVEILGVDRAEIERAILEYDHVRRQNPGAADWRINAGRLVIVYQHPDQGDRSAARVVTVWRKR